MSDHKFSSTTMVLLAICGTLLAGCDSRGGAESRRDHASGLLAQGEYNSALIELKNLLDENPQNPPALLLQARVFQQLGNLDASAKTLDAAAEAGAQPREVAALRAQLHLRAGRNQELLAMLDDPAMQPGHSATLRAQALGALDRCQEAIPQARAAIAADAADAAARIVVAECYGRHRDSARALKELEAAVTAAPESADAWLALGRVQHLLNRDADAHESWTRSAQLSPGQLSVPQQALLFSALADLQVKRNEAEALRETHRRLLHLAPQASFTELVGARLLLMEGKLAEASKALRRLAVNAPDLPAVHALLASTYLSQGNIGQARQELGWMEQNAPGSLRDKSARQSLDAAAAAKSGSAEYWVGMAEVQTALGQLDQARAAIDNALQVEPQWLPALVGRARAELIAGNLPHARELGAELAKTHAADPAVTALRADLLTAAGEYRDADALLQASFSKTPSARLAVLLYRVRLAGKLADPRQPLEAWLARHPDDVRVRIFLAESLQTAGDNERAIAEYERLQAGGGTNAVLLNNLAWLYHLTGDARALPTAKRAWQQAKDAPAIADTYGWLLVASGSVEEGAAILAKADSAVGLTQPEIRYHHAAALVRLGQDDRARALLEGVLVEHPEFSSRAAASRLLESLTGEKTT